MRWCALTYFPSFKGTDARGWLLQIVCNAAYGSTKLKCGIQMVSNANWPEDGTGVVIDRASGDDDPEARLIKLRDRCHVRRMIAALPVELSEALALPELGELSSKEIAVLAHTPIGAAMSQMWRARRLLAQTDLMPVQAPTHVKEG